MKGFKSILVLLSMFLSVQVMAQSDLRVVTSQNSYQFEGDGQENTITFEFDNIGALTSNPVAVTFTKDMFVDPNFNFQSANSGAFNCVNNGESMDCSFIPTSFDPNTPYFIDLVIVMNQTGTFDLTPAFSVNIEDQAGGDINPGNNLLFVNLQYLGSAPDLALSSNSPFQFPNDGQEYFIDFTIDNIGTSNAGDGIDIDFSVIDPNLTFTGNSLGDPTWNCANIQNNNQCVYQGNLFPAGSSTFSVGVMMPVGDFDLSPAINATITDSGGIETELSNNFASIDIQFGAAGGVDIELVKTLTTGFSNTVAPGDPISFDITVNHITGADATDLLVFDDLLVNNLIFDQANSSPECTQLSSFVECNLAILPTGDSVTFTIAATVDALAQPNTYTNTADVFATETDPVTGNNSDGQTYTVAVGAPEIEITKSIVGSFTEVIQGGELEYLIEVNNTGVGDASNVVFTDVLPVGVTYQNHTELGNFNCNYAGVTLTCTAPNLPVTAAQDGVRINVTADGVLGQVLNTASTTFIDGDPSNNTSTVLFNIIAPEADLDITIVSDDFNYSAGDLITHTLTLHNPTASTGEPTNTVLTVTLSPETVFQSAQETTTVGFSCSHDGSSAGGVVTCDSQGNALPIGTNTFFDVVALATMPTPSTNSQADASITSEFDSFPSNDFDTSLFFINNGSANLSLVFTSIPGVYTQGDSIAYTVDIENPMIIPRQADKSSQQAFGSQDAEVTFTLPNEVSFDNADVSAAIDWNCTHDNAANGGIVTCDKGGIPFASGDFDTITVNVVASQAATNALVQAEISSVADNDLSNNSDSYSDVINGATSNFSISKTVSGTDFAIGDTFTYLLTINNPTASTASPIDVQVNDQLPVDVSFDNFIVGTNLGTTIICSHDGSAFGGLFSCDTNGAPFPPGETVTIDVNVTAESANNNVDNTATVETITDSDGTANNNSDSSATVVINGTLLTNVTATKRAIVGGVDISDVSLGQPFEYELIVENTGLNDAINVSIYDAIPPEVILNNIQSVGWTCFNNQTKSVKGDFGNSDVDCILDTPLPPGSTAQITVDVTVVNNPSIVSIVNQMDVNADNIGPTVTADVSIIVSNSNATLTLTQMPSPVDPEADVEFGLQVNNTGSTDLTGVAISTQLPFGFTYSGFNGSAGWACNENTGVVDCSFTGTIVSNANIELNLETTAPIPLSNQSYSLNSTFSANELTSDITESLSVAFSTSDYTLSATSSPVAVVSGQPFRHVIEVDNTGTFDLVNASLGYRNSSIASVDSIVSTDFSCALVGNVYNCTNLQPINVGDSAQITVFLNANAGLTGLVADITAQIDGNDKTTQVFTNVVNENLNDLSLIKTASVNEIGFNESFSYLLSVTNLGSETQTDFSVVDMMPEGVVFQAASGVDWNCDGEVEVICQYGGSLFSNQSTQLVLNVIAPSVAGQITNTAILNSVSDENAANNSSSAAVTVDDGNVGGNGIADLAVTVAVSSDEVINTEQVIWQFDIENLGPNAAQNVIFSNMLPMGFIAESVQVSDGATCVLLSSSLQCEIETLPFAETAQIILEGSFMNEFTGLLMNSVEVGSDSTDPNPSNNVAISEVNVTSVEDLNADLALELNVNGQNIQQGDVFDLSFMAKNLGPDKAINTMIEGSVSGLIDSVQFLNSSGWVCQVSGTSFSCMMPAEFNVGMNAAFELRINTQQVVQQSQPVLFNASITSESMDTQPGNNMIGFTNDVSRTPTEDEIFALFQNAVGSGASETVIQSIRNVSSYCARSYFMAIEGLCDEFIEDATPENGSAIINAMEEITPNEVAAQSNSAAEIISSQFRNVGSRLAQLRGGSGSGFSVAGLNARYGNESIPLGMLAYLNQSEEEQQAVSNINDFISPWGFFVNGSISMGERDATGRELGFDFDTFGLTAGVDYRFSPTKVAGVALGYANFDSEIEGEAEMKSTGLTLTGYGSFYLKDNFYVDARISYGNPDFEQKRRINFTVDEIDIDRVATGKTDADQYSVAMSAGYHFNKNSWVITPNASIRYVRTTIDAFQESGAGGFNFAFGEQEVKSMVWSLGASVSKAISLKNGIISPQFDFNLSRETENDGGLLETRFIEAPDDEIFWIGTDEPDRTFGSAGVGLVFIGANGKQAYINYRSIFGLDGFTRGTINVGARFEF